MTDRRYIEDAEAVGTMFDQDALRDAERPPVFLPRREVERRVGMSRSTIYDRLKAGTFPEPVRDLETGTVWWVEAEVVAWQRARIAARDATRGKGRPQYG